MGQGEARVQGLKVGTIALWWIQRVQAARNWADMKILTHGGLRRAPAGPAVPRGPQAAGRLALFLTVPGTKRNAEQ